MDNKRASIKYPMDNEDYFFKIIIIAVLLVIAGTVLANIIYFGDVSKGECANISADSGTTMMWLNIVLFVIIFGIFIWAVIRLFFNKDAKKAKVQEAKEAFNESPGVKNPPPMNKPGNQPMNHLGNQPMGYPGNHPGNQPMNQQPPMNQRPY